MYLCKYNGNRWQDKASKLAFHAEAHSILCKDSARRVQNKTNLFVFYAKPQPILSKYSESREQNKKRTCSFFCFTEARQALLKLAYRHAPKCIFLTLLIGLLTIAMPAHGKSAAYLEYIEKYHHIAIVHQQQYGIPASITLAQGLLESRAGRSRLATQGNNHFGIKCHGQAWDGGKIYADDDERNECFRSYRSADDSFEDHARFLKQKRYAPLFKLKVTDYKGWARTLRQCGYATDKRYADKLIDIIESYELYRYDTGQPIIAKPKHLEGDESLEHSIDNEIYEELTSTHDIVQRNGLYCVIAKSGDSYSSIADEFGMRTRKLTSFNDMSWRDRNDEIPAGSIIYIEEKNDTAAPGIPDVYVTRTGDTTHDISQQFGIKVKSLCKLNRLSTKNSRRSLKPGIRISLR